MSGGRKPIESCIVCGGGRIAPVVDIPDVPVHCNVICNTREEALSAPRGCIDLVVCHDCGHLFNAAFDATRMQYGGTYENSLHGSPTFRRYAEALADRLIADHDLRGKNVVEIGCGDGRFLELICARGGNRGFGFDPGARPRRHGTHGEDVQIFADAHDGARDRPRGDLVICRHVLEHVIVPHAFVDLLIGAATASSGALYIEVPNGMYTLAGGLVWDLIYEHCSCFSRSSLIRLLTDCGLAVSRVAPEYGEQFLCADAAPAHESAVGSAARPVPEAVAHAGSFAALFHDTVGFWRERLAAFAGEGRTVAVWGAGSKGVTFLNLVERGDGSVRYIVDVNPRKRGRFVAGTGQEIVCPDALRELRPDLVLLMNPLYVDDVRQELARLGLSPAIEVAGPGIGEDEARVDNRMRAMPAFRME